MLKIWRESADLDPWTLPGPPVTMKLNSKVSFVEVDGTLSIQDFVSTL